MTNCAWNTTFRLNSRTATHLLLLCGFIASAGCGNSPSESAPDQLVSGDPVVLPAGPAGIAPAVEPVQAAQAKHRASELLDQLIRPGIEGADWDTAQAEIVQLGAGAVSALAAALTDDNLVRREMAASMLALLGPEAISAAPELRAALQDASPFVKANAAAALVQFPEHAPAAVAALIELLSATDPQLRQLAVMNLGVVDTEAAGHVPQLVNAIRTETAPEVLLPVLQLLGRIGPAAQPALPRIEQLASQSTGEVSDAASQAIQLISGTSGTSELK